MPGWDIALADARDTIVAGELSGIKARLLLAGKASTDTIGAALAHQP